MTRNVLVIGGGRAAGRRWSGGCSRTSVGRADHVASTRSTADGKVSTPSLMRLASRKSSGYVCSVLSICGKSIVSMSPRAIGQRLRLNVDVGRAGVAGVADPGNWLALADLLPDVDFDAALTEVPHHQVAATPDVDHQLISDG